MHRVRVHFMPRDIEVEKKMIFRPDDADHVHTDKYIIPDIFIETDKDEYDIALLKLPGTVYHSHFANLPVKSDDCQYIKPRTKVTAIGFGSTVEDDVVGARHLKKMDGEIYSGSELPSPPKYDPEENIILYGNGKDSTAYGDSGGPLLAHRKDGSLVQVGVVSGEISPLNLYATNVLAHFSWITKHTGIQMENVPSCPTESTTRSGQDVRDRQRVGARGESKGSFISKKT